MDSFTVSLAGAGGDCGEMHSGARRAVRVGPPVEWGGEPEAWCPESLLAASVAGSLMVSFHHVLHGHGGRVRSYTSAAKTVVGRTDQGRQVTGVEVSAVIGVNGRAELAAARQAAREAEGECSICHSLACPVRVTWQIHEVPATGPEACKGRRKETLE